LTRLGEAAASLLQHLFPNLFHSFEALSSFVREGHDRIAARMWTPSAE
jgi:hypothetical protein